MKPSDRSLDIAVIGLGQAGGNLAAEFSRRGYRAMALNTARTDLTALGNSPRHGLTEAQRLYIGLDGYDGAGADLNYGRECVSESSERIREAVARHTEGADVVMLAAGLGGGTGSAVAELVRTLDALDLPLVTLTTLPSDQESGIAKVNAVRAVSELVKLPDLGMIFADNARLAQLHGKVRLDEYFQRVNEIIVDPLDAFNHLNGRDGLHPIRTLDGEDLRTLLMSTGVVNYAAGQLDELTVESVLEWVAETLRASQVMPAGFGMSDLAYVGLVIEASAALLSNTPFTFFNEVSERLKTETSGAGIYMGVYRNEKMADLAPATIRILASTPALPEGIQSIVSDAQREGNTLREKLNRAVSSLDLGDIANLDLLPSRTGSLQPNAPSKGRRRGRISRRPQVALLSNEESQAAGETSSGSDGEVPPLRRRDVPQTMPAADSGARAAKPPSIPRSKPPPVSLHSSPPPSGSTPPPLPLHDLPPESLDPATETGDKSEPETYDRLVDAFLNTSSESVRKRIATRLHTSRNSDHPLARFYANRAIERLVDAGEEEALENVMSLLGA